MVGITLSWVWVTSRATGNCIEAAYAELIVFKHSVFLTEDRVPTVGPKSVDPF